MDEVLGELRQEGRLDSEGRFTVELESAVRKLGERQFELPGLYLLKLIQACVAFEATSIELRIKAAAVSFEARLATFPSGVCSLSRGPFQDFESAGARHLAWAWAALVALEPERAELTLGGQRYVFRAGKVTQQEVQGENVVRLLVTKAGVRWWQRLLPPRTAEHALVSRLAGYCPVSLRVDGRWVDGSEPRLWSWQRGKLRITTTAFWQPITRDYPVGHRLVFRPGGKLSARPPLLTDSGTVAFDAHEIRTVGVNFPGRPLVYSWKWPQPVEPILLHGKYRPEHSALSGSYMLGYHTGWRQEGYVADLLAFLALPPESVEPFLGSSRRHVGPSLALKGSELMFANDYFSQATEQRVPLCWAHLFVPAHQLPGTGWIYPCQHGVVLDPVPIDLNGAVAVVTADDCETDLSQLRVVENERWQELVSEVRAELWDFKSFLIGSKGVGHLADIDYLVMSHVQKQLG